MRSYLKKAIDLGIEGVDSPVEVERIRICNRITVITLGLGVFATIAITPVIPLWLSLAIIASIPLVGSPLLLMVFGHHYTARILSIGLAQVSITSLMAVFGPQAKQEILYLPLIAYTVIIADQKTWKFSAASVLLSTALLLAGESLSNFDNARIDNYTVVALTNKLLCVLWLLVLLHSLIRQFPMLSKVINAQNLQLASQARRAELGETAEIIAHEINNPLAVIQGYNYSLNKQLKKPEPNIANAIETTEKMSRAHEKLNQLIRAMRSFAMADGPSKPGRIALRVSIDDSIILCGSFFEDSDIDVAIDADISDIYIEGHQARLTQVFLNLLNNARDAVPKDGTGRIMVRRVDSSDSDRYVIEVCDNGPGLPFADLEEAAKAFNTSRADQLGTGLGLAITKKILSQYRAELSYERLENWTVFRLNFPAA